MIDVANQMGLDKHTWDKRLKWTADNVNHLEAFNNKAKDPILYFKAVKAYRAAEAGEPTGYLMSLDATASGYQLMAVLSGCAKSLKNTNMINTGNREDIYTKIADEMNKLPGIAVTREIIKKPVMTTGYGSKKQPMEVFGEDTPELQAFYNVLFRELPGPMELMSTMQACWNPTTFAHSWTMPDRHKIVAKVMVPIDKKIEVDELAHSTFTHRAMINMPSKKGLSLSANIIHSCDSLVVRELLRRCSYDTNKVNRSCDIIRKEIHKRKCKNAENSRKHGEI